MNFTVSESEASHPQHRRRDIFVEPVPQCFTSPVGATYFIRSSEDAAPTELESFFQRHLQICRTYGAAPESQRDSIIQPKGCRVREATLGQTFYFFPTPTGLHHLHTGTMQPRWGKPNRV